MACLLDAVRNLDGVEALLFSYISKILEHLFGDALGNESQPVVTRPFCQNEIVEVSTFLHVIRIKINNLGRIIIKELDDVGFLSGCYTGCIFDQPNWLSNYG